jgi:hypothetical protein
MTYILKIFDVNDNFTQPVWILRYAPSEPVPFTTLEGTECSWVWDFISGAFLKDGEVLTGHTVEISAEGGE